MLLATPKFPKLQTLFFSIFGIWLLASAAFAINCLIEREIDSRMARTTQRSIVCYELSITQILIFSSIIGSIGMWILFSFINTLTMWLTLITFIGYTIIYTVILKPSTPQSIVIGGLFGAMPPAIGWAAITNDISVQALILVLIIFIWTPPHFWTLALYHLDDYIESGLPMLPITHGTELTKFHIFLYTIKLMAATMLPFAIKMSGLIYLSSAIILNLFFFYYVLQIYYYYSNNIARKTFKFSIFYLLLIFVALIIDHYYFL